MADIATTPLISPCRNLRADSTGFPYDLCGLAAHDKPVMTPTQFTLYQNYPNPFNPNTKIQFDLRTEGPVTLRVFDVLGREVSILLSGKRIAAGVHVVEFDAANLASGVYLCRLEAAGSSVTRKMVLMK